MEVDISTWATWLEWMEAVCGVTGVSYARLDTLPAGRVQLAKRACGCYRWGGDCWKQYEEKHSGIAAETEHGEQQRWHPAYKSPPQWQVLLRATLAGP